MTSANRKLSCSLRNEPPPGVSTSETDEKPCPTRHVELMATKASQAQSRYVWLPGYGLVRVMIYMGFGSHWTRTCGSESVVIALDNFRAQIVQRIGDVEAMLVVESRVGWW